jgi:hypothetical protein
MKANNKNKDTAGCAHAARKRLLSFFGACACLPLKKTKQLRSAIAHNANAHINLALKLKMQSFSEKQYMANEEGFEAVSNRFCLFLEVAISNSY